MDNELPRIMREESYIIENLQNEHRIFKNWKAAGHDVITAKGAARTIQGYFPADVKIGTRTAVVLEMMRPALEMAIDADIHDRLNALAERWDEKEPS